MRQPRYSRRCFLNLASSAAIGCAAYSVRAQSTAERPSLSKATQYTEAAFRPAFHVGDFALIYDPSVGEDRKWYINDHTFIRARDGQWHLFGITHPEPADPQDEKIFAHATAPGLLGPWTKQAPVLPADPGAGETVVWAPYVLEHDGIYWMYYCAGGARHDRYRIHLATSNDLFHWERSSANPMLIDGYDARDPMVLKLNDRWVLYYCATSAPEGGHHTVKAAISKDLVHWSEPREVFRHPATGTSAGPTESPFIVHRNGKYYLFVCTNKNSNQTAAYVSHSPFHWHVRDLAGIFPAHAAEIVQTPEGKWYASRAGWGQGGVYLAELEWL